MKKLNILLVILGISFFVSFSFTKITDYKNEEVKEKINQINYSNDLLDKENLSFFSTEDRDIVKQLNDYVLNIEEELNKKSSSILLELEKMINDYEEKIMQLDKNKSENEINILKQTIESLVSSKKKSFKIIKRKFYYRNICYTESFCSNYYQFVYHCFRRGAQCDSYILQF